ncbi:LamG domain-containing protein [archaeon]|jgi:hypothetical protein|nr:LamG domain-containing protein [archaeon]MBT3731154.1 LamG domain-containing protein [archaeon]MBT4670092.1 LamG domain-containing protein [archaeon]MBT5030608.1 LamG domain-containing protein [archaeon]MBT5287960.1 LamG domain-containing protein [archaeon]
MFKKTIEGRTYYHTTYKDKDNKIRNQYLGTSESEALEKEKKIKNFKKFPKSAILFIFLGIILITFLLQWSTLTGFFFLETTNIVTFDIDDTWDLTNSFIRISQNETFFDINDLTDLVQNNKISIDLRNYDLLEGYLYVDLIVDDSVVASKYVYFSLSYEEPEEESILETITETFEDTITETFSEEATAETSEEQDTTSLFETYDNWFDANSTGTFQVDYLAIEPQTAFNNNTLTCANGTTSTDVTHLYYLWYLNDSYLGSANRNSTLDTGNFSVGEYVDCAILPQSNADLIAYWPFDEGSGTTINDVIGRNNGVLVNSLGWDTGKYSKSIVFSATENMTITTPSELNHTMNFTHEFWVYPTAATDLQVFDYGTFTISVNAYEPQIDFQGSGEDPGLKLSTFGGAPKNIWTHLAFTYDSSTISIYVNGVLDNSTSYNLALTGMNGTAYIGTDESGLPFRGLIDEYAIFNRSLTATEVLDHYQNGIITYSRNSTLIAETQKYNYNNGTLTNVNITAESGNITLANDSTVYYSRGNFTSQIFELKDWNDEAFLRWNNETPAGTNLTMQLRTGHRLYNESIVWSEFSGSDPTRAKDDNIVLALDFTSKETNLTTELRTGNDLIIKPNYFVYDGVHSSGALYSGKVVTSVSNGFTDLRLSTVQNYSIEIWVKPRNTVEDIGFLSKTNYQLHTNSSGNLQFIMDTGNVDYSLNSTSVLPLNSWSHILISNNADNMTSLYLNGKKESNITMNGTIAGSTSILKLGGSDGKSTFNGSIDSVIIYNRTLSEQDAYEHYIGRYHNSNGEYTPALNDVFQYRAIFETSDTAISPTLTDINLKLRNYTTHIQNNPVSATNLTAPGFSLNLSLGSYSFNWTNATDIDSDYIYYEFILANFSNFSSPILSRFAINNFSELDKADDNYTILVEHFENLEDLNSNSWLTEDTGFEPGRWSEGLEISGSTDYLKISASGVISNISGTIEFWAKPYWAPTDSEDNFFIHQNNDRIELNRTNSLLSLRFGDNLHTPLTYNISSWSASEWHHIAFSWETEKNVTLFLDGVQVNKTSLDAIPHNFQGFFFVGSRTNSGAQFDGVIDEIRISNVARDSITNLNWTNYSYVSPSSYADGTYLWQARALSSKAQLSDRSRTTYFSAWDNETVVFETRAPVISITDDPSKELSDASTLLLLTTDELSTCYWKNKSIAFEPMSSPDSMSHNVTVNITEYGIDTFYFLCNDSFGRTTNETTSYYVFENEDAIYETSAKYNFTANQVNNLSITTTDSLNLTTQNDITGKAYLVVHTWAKFPEYTTIDYGIKAPTKYMTYFLDENIENNITGNITIDLAYSSSDTDDRERDTARIYYFNHSFDPANNLGNWSEFYSDIYTLSSSGGDELINTTKMGTYTFFVNLTEDLILSRSTTAASSGEGLAADDVIEIEIEEEEEFYELEFYFTEILGGEENYLEVYDEETGILELYFTSNTNQEDVFILVGSNVNTQDDIYKSFYIDGLNLKDSELDTLSIIYGVEKSWSDNYLDQELIIQDKDGNTFAFELIEEDEDFGYYYAELDSFATFYVTTGDTIVEEVVEEIEEEEEEESFAEEVLSSLLAADFDSESVSTSVAILLYIILANFAIFYFFRAGISTILSTGKLYDIEDSELTFEEEDEFTSKLKNYIYSQIERGMDPISITKLLTDKGWDESKVKDIINNFKL